jgi:hypothetical protein
MVIGLFYLSSVMNDIEKVQSTLGVSIFYAFPMRNERF